MLKHGKDHGCHGDDLTYSFLDLGKISFSETKPKTPHL